MVQIPFHQTLSHIILIGGVCKQIHQERYAGKDGHSTPIIQAWVCSLHHLIHQQSMLQSNPPPLSPPWVGYSLKGLCPNSIVHWEIHKRGLFSMLNDIHCIDDSRTSIQCMVFDTVEIEYTQTSVTSITQSWFRGHPFPGGRINAHLSL